MSSQRGLWFNQESPQFYSEATQKISSHTPSSQKQNSQDWVCPAARRAGQEPSGKLHGPRHFNCQVHLDLCVPALWQFVLAEKTVRHRILVFSCSPVIKAICLKPCFGANTGMNK